MYVYGMEVLRQHYIYIFVAIYAADIFLFFAFMFHSILRYLCLGAVSLNGHLAADSVG